MGKNPSNSILFKGNKFCWKYAKGFNLRIQAGLGMPSRITSRASYRLRNKLRHHIKTLLVYQFFSWQKRILASALLPPLMFHILLQAHWWQTDLCFYFQHRGPVKDNGWLIPAVCFLSVPARISPTIFLSVERG